MGCIYCSTNKVNGKIYIGKTINALEYRKAQHKRNRNKTYFCKAIKKYGFENFVFESIFESDDEEELLYIEKVYIALFDSSNKNIGYNLTVGGNGVSGLKHSEESRHKMSISNSKPRPWMEKPIEMFDSLTGEFLNSFKSTGKAVEELGLKRTSINNNLNGLSKIVRNKENKVFFKYK